jgi:conjugal transfer pilus assembly protein TraV
VKHIVMSASTIATLGVIASVALLTGCAGTVSTYGGESSFKCAAKFDDGVPCDSISGTSANFSAGNLSWQQRQQSGQATGGAVPSTGEISQKMRALQDLPPVLGSATPGNTSGPSYEKLSPRQLPTPSTGMPLRIPERILRIWVAPYEDEESALNDQKYIYLTVQKGAWQVEANKLNVQNTYKQIYPLGRSNGAEEPSTGSQRATARSQAQGALINNPNLTNVPTPRPSAENETE